MLLTLSELNAADRSDFTEKLGHLFEHSPWVAHETWPRRPFRDAAHLHAELCATMRDAMPERQLELIRAHPDLAGPLARGNRLTPESTREQASAGLDRMCVDDMGLFQEFNDAYRARFGFPFVICARRHDRLAIMGEMQARLNETPEMEFVTALKEIEKIAWLRLGDLLKPTE
jgi:2-oxo-4-hydroxy-4-carboxy-5-ureidoimidazoline decarboxylase